MAGFLITNNSNTHPPEAWAIETAQAIFDVNDNVPAATRIPAMRLQIAIAEALTPHHARVQADEQAALDADAATQFSAPHDPSVYFDQAVTDIQAAAASTPWAAQFAAPDMVEQIKRVLGSHFATAQHIHRQAHARANPEHPEGQAFMAALSAAPGV
jgi:hypothetical protein